MQKIIRSAHVLAIASKGNPVTATCTVMLFALMVNIMESVIEKLIFGDRFEHLLDIVILLVFIGYAAFAVYACAVFNSNDGEQ